MAKNFKRRMPVSAVSEEAVRKILSWKDDSVPYDFPKAGTPDEIATAVSNARSLKEALGDPSDFFRALFSWKGLESVRFPYVLPSGAKKTLAGIISENAVFSGWGVSPDGEPSFEVGTVDETVIHRAALFLSGDFPYYAGHFDKYAFSVAARKFTEGALSHADFKEISDFCPRDYEFFKSALNAVIRAVEAETPSEKAEAFFSFVVGELGLKLPADVFGGRRSAEINGCRSGMDFLGELVSSEPVNVSVVSDYEFAETSKVLRRQGYRFHGKSSNCPYPVVISVNSWHGIARNPGIASWSAYPCYGGVRSVSLSTYRRESELSVMESMGIPNPRAHLPAFLQ